MKDEFKLIAEKSQILVNEPMSKHTSFKIGGLTDVLLLPKTKLELISLITICKQNNFPFYIIGNGSNLLVTDKGFRGIIIKIAENYSKIEVSNNTITCEAGALLSTLANTALEHELAGLEFAAGIPGTVGGAVCMNAGAYDGEIKDAVVSAEVLKQDGTVAVLTNEQLEFGYRTSIIQKMQDSVLLSATFCLKHGNKEQIKSKMEELKRKRKERQPLELPSAGSTFKRPKGYYAGKLIMDCGLKGYRIGGAEVSKKHCGFIVNAKNATAKDVLDLIKHVKTVVLEKFNIELEEEIKIIGEQ